MMLENGFVLRWERDRAGLHEFCGPNRIAEADCPNCAKPLLQLVRLNLDDPKLLDLRNESGLGQIPLLWCWTCEIPRGWFEYKLLDQGARVDVIGWTRGRKHRDRPYRGYPSEFPAAWATLEDISSTVAEDVRRLNRREIKLSSVHREQWAKPRHQVGGEPFFSGGMPERPRCSACGQHPELLAAVADECTDPRGFAGNEFVQTLFWLCSRCAVVLAQQDSD